MKKESKRLISLVLALLVLFCIPSTAFAAGRDELLYPDEIVILGAYEQDGVKSNGPEDIAWRVLEARGDYALLISEKILDARRYNSKRAEVTWEECTLREWLNEDFYETAFSDEEQEAILTTGVDNSRGQGNSTWNRNGGEDTEDKVFLLSYSEVREYFDNDKERRCEPTEYAVSRGIWKDKNGTSHWWLRSPGSSQYYTAYCSYLGNISSTWDNNDAIGVRPVIRININAVNTGSVSDVVANNGYEAVLTNNPDFRIEDGVLVEYLGRGGVVSIPSGVTSIDERAFYDCKSLTNVTIPDSVTGIGINAFRGCSSLSNVKIPDGITNIEWGAFWGCSSLESVTIPDTVTTIGELAFSECTSLTNVTIPDSVSTIGDYAFSDCSNLKSVTIPDSVTTIGAAVFSGTPWFAEQAAANDAVIINGILIKYNGTENEVLIPDSVTTIGERAFSENGSLTSVTIPDSVTSIGRSAFSGCSSLTSVMIPDSVTSIGVGAFEGCENLVNINIPESVTFIGEYAFMGCGSLTRISLPDEISYIGYATFLNCANLQTVVLPRSIKHIGMSAFGACQALENIIIPGSIKSIGPSAFYGCSHLTKVDLPAHIESIGVGAFRGTPWIETITTKDGFVIVSGNLLEYRGNDSKVIIPEGVTFIGEYAFSEDYGDEHKLTEVTIPGTVKIIDRFSFSNCSKLTSVIIQEGVQSIGLGAFMGCGLKNVNLPKSVQSVGSMAFEGTPWFTEMIKKEEIIVSGDVLVKYCGNESEVVIPDNIRIIADEAFYYDDYYNPENLNRVVIPDGVLHIGQNAFDGCINLQSIEIPISVQDIGHAAFRDTAWFKGQMAERDYVIVNDILIAYNGEKEEAIVPDGVRSIAGDVFYSEVLKSVRISRSVTSVYEDLTGLMADNYTDVYYDGVLLESWTESRYEMSIARYDFPEIVTVLHANY